MQQAYQPKNHAASLKRKSASADENMINQTSLLNNVLISKKARPLNGSGSGATHRAGANSSSTPNKSPGRMNVLGARNGNGNGITPGSASKSKSGLSSSSQQRERERPTVMLPDQPPTSERIKSIFDEGLSVPMERAHMIMAPILNPKKTGDFKEKQKRTEHVVKELRDSINAVFNDLSGLKSKSAAHEVNLLSQIRDYHVLITDNSRKAFSLTDNENRYKEEIHRLRLENDKIEYKLSEFMYEKKKLQEMSDGNDRIIRESESKRASEEMQKAENQNHLQQMDSEILAARREAVEAGRRTKDECDARYSLALQPHMDERTALRQELSRRQMDAEKGYCEQLDIDRISSKLEEQQLRIQSSIHEEISKATRNIQEIESLSSQLKHAKEDITTKDAELRIKLSSLSELQRKFSDENSSIRSERSVLEQRVNTVQAEKCKLQSKISVIKKESAEVREKKSILGDRINHMEIEKSGIESELKETERLSSELQVARADCKESEIREATERRERIEACDQLRQAQLENVTLLRALDDRFLAQIEGERSRLAVLSTTKDDLIQARSANNEAIVSYNSEISQLQYELNNKSTTQEAEQALQTLLMEVDGTKREYEHAVYEKELKRDVHEQQISLFRDQLKQGELQRRKLQNAIQELRGNIRVFARVRPYISSLDCPEVAEGEESTISTRQDDVTHILSLARDRKSAPVDFSLDRVFGLTSSQEHVYSEVREMVQAALEGYNVCVMAYGQASSGKTHTMYGCGTELNKGIVPRALEQAFRHKTEIERNKDWTYRIQVSFFEISNETIKDRLRPGTSPELQHEIRSESPYNVTDLHRETIDCMEKVDEILEHAARQRGISYNNDSTSWDGSMSNGSSMSMNSSRTAASGLPSVAHSILTLHISAVNAVRGEQIDGSLIFCDLAGSAPASSCYSASAENCNNSNINNNSMVLEEISTCPPTDRALDSLINVFRCIESKQFSIPYKNSKLTHYLQPALSQNGKILMVVNLCPKEDSFEESLSTLRFSEIVKRCELGKAEKCKPKKMLNAASKDKVSGASKQMSTLSQSSLNRDKVATAASKFKR